MLLPDIFSTLVTKTALYSYNIPLMKNANTKNILRVQAVKFEKFVLLQYTCTEYRINIEINYHSMFKNKSRQYNKTCDVSSARKIRKCSG